MADLVISDSLVETLRRAQAHSDNLAAALVAFRDACAWEEIPFGVVGALAMSEYRYVRFTEHIDIVTTQEGLARIHDRLLGRGLVARGPGLRKKFRDTTHKVNIDVIQSGEHAGAKGSPVTYPSPHAPEFGNEHDGVRYATLPALVSFKLASGRWGKRPRDLADVIELIKANKLDESWATNLPELLREEFNGLVQASREERDIE